MSTGPLITPASSISASAEAALAATKTPGPPPAQTVLPRWLVTAGAWSWRLIALGIVGYFLLKFILRIEVVVLPCLAALVFCALLRPLALFFQHHGLSRLLATWAAFLIAVLVVLGIGTLVVYRSVAEWHTLVKDLSATSDKLRNWLSTGPLHLKNTRPREPPAEGNRPAQSAPRRDRQRGGEWCERGRRVRRRHRVDGIHHLLPHLRRRAHLALCHVALSRPHCRARRPGCARCVDHVVRLHPRKRDHRDLPRARHGHHVVDPRSPARRTADAVWCSSPASCHSSAFSSAAAWRCL